jgi:hypothetical protein
MLGEPHVRPLTKTGITLIFQNKCRAFYFFNIVLISVIVHTKILLLSFGMRMNAYSIQDLLPPPVIKRAR